MATGGPEDWQPAIVTDLGTGYIKLGLAGDDSPKVVYPTLVGTLKHTTVMAGTKVKSYYVGDDAEAKRGILLLTNPIHHGIVKDEAGVEALIDHGINNLIRCNATEHPILLTEAPMNPKVNRERMCTMCFESFGCPGFYISIQAVLSLYASGRTTGIVMDCGDGVQHSVPVVQGCYFANGTGRTDVAGRDLTKDMRDKLQLKGVEMGRSSDLQTAKEVKECTCYVCINYDAELEACNADPSAFAMKFEMPDGSIIVVDSERFTVPENLFQPALLHVEQPGMHILVNNSVEACGYELRKDLRKNCIMSGSTTQFKGIEDRLTKELKILAPDGQVLVIAPPERKFSVWIGGSILASLSTFQPLWITKEEYEESGAPIVHRKCT